MTQAHGKYGVFGWDRDAALDLLELANEFRREYVYAQQVRHEEIIEFRNQYFPALFEAVQVREHAFARVKEVKDGIKLYHSDVRDRNAYTPTMKEELLYWEAQERAAKAVVAVRRKEYNEFRAGFKKWWNTLADWQNIKTLKRRKMLYAEIELPEDDRSQAYGVPYIEFDLFIRELAVEYQDRGLSSAIRLEIVESSQPKIGLDGPGIRYRFGQGKRLMEKLRKWGKLSTHFNTGLSLAKALVGKKQLTITRQDDQYYRVQQQVGTKEHPVLMDYRVKFDRPLPPDTVFRRFALVVERTESISFNGNRGLKATVVPTVAANIVKPLGHGKCAYRLRWTVRKQGVEIANIWGDHINERVIIPNWLVARRMSVKDTQAKLDLEANALLAELGQPSQTGKRQGLRNFADYVADNSTDMASVNWFLDAREEMQAARKVAKRAERTINHIYLTVAYRVGCHHDEIFHDPIDLSKIKRYDTRDLLVVDPLPKRSREILHAMAPGKLRAALKARGMEELKESPPPLPDGTPPTHLFDLYVDSIGISTTDEGPHGAAEMSNKLVEEFVLE